MSGMHRVYSTFGVLGTASAVCRGMKTLIDNVPAQRHLTVHAATTPTVRRLHKFGGSSLASPTHFRRVVEIIREHSSSDDLIVVSAAGNTTNQIIQWINDVRGPEVRRTQIECQLRHFQIGLIQRLLSGDKADSLTRQFEKDFERIQSMIPAGEPSSEIQGFGEVWSARLLTAVLNETLGPTVMVDSRTVLRANPGLQPIVDMERSAPMQEILNAHNDVRFVITGYMASSQSGSTVLLGRNGSDYSATSIGKLANVEEVVIWSDVAGIFTADPRRVPEARLQSSLSLDEANELAKRGAGVLHGRTLQPACNSQLRVSMRSSLDPNSGTTRICADLERGRTAVKSIVAVEGVCLFRIPLGSAVSANEKLKQLQQLLTNVSAAPLMIVVHGGEVRIAVKEADAGELRALLRFDFDSGFSLVSAVGRGVGKDLIAQSALRETFTDQTVAASLQTDISLSVLVRSKSTDEAVRKLHAMLIH